MDDQSIPTSSESTIVENNQETQSRNKSFFTKKKLLILVSVIVVILIPVFLLLTINNRSTEDNVANLPPQEPENVLLAVAYGKEIRRSDIRKIALEQYLASGINGDILRIALDIAIERAILDNERERLSIAVEPNENKINYYNTLKTEVMTRKIGTVTANSISFWVPAFNDIYPQTPEYQEMRDLQPQVFTEATQLLENGESAYEVGQQILEKYPVYTPKLAVNSYILAQVDNALLMQEPITYEYQVNDSNKLFLDFMFNMNPGQIRTLVWPDGEGAALVQVTDKSAGEKIPYEEWLNEKKKDIELYNEEIAKL